MTSPQALFWVPGRLHKPDQALPQRYASSFRASEAFQNSATYQSPQTWLPELRLCFLTKITATFPLASVNTAGTEGYPYMLKVAFGMID